MSDADEFIFFEDCAVPDVRKTRIVNVLNRRSRDVLGQIRWYGSWRQYCFFPSEATIFNPTCMARITREVVDMQVAHMEASNG